MVSLIVHSCAIWSAFAARPCWHHRGRCGSLRPMTIEIDLRGKAPLVRGAGAGIGREIARWLARAGADVAINDIDPARAQATADLITGEGGGSGRAAIAPADVRDP